MEEASSAGLVIDGPKGRKIPNPLLAEARRQTDLLLRRSLQLGLTPTSRNRVAMAQRHTSDQEGKFARFLGPRVRSETPSYSRRTTARLQTATHTCWDSLVFVAHQVRVGGEFDLDRRRCTVTVA
jgi:hypothetical protein